ncbi:hypothetical protein NMY22_g14952 [Coprinellus aureogranulatus]|nr:hypothetical protein NMY22_g14952 [Coprinellus aureogranulatus]
MPPTTRSKRRKQTSEAQAQEHAEKLRKSSTCVLHYELLAEIFQLVLFQHGASESGQEELVNLMLVCHQWRNVALNTPRLWSQVAFDLVGTRSEEDDIIRRCKLWFSRAKSLPLSIDVFHRRDSPSLMGPIFVEDDYYPNKDKLWDYLSSVPQLHRVRLTGGSVSCVYSWFGRPRRNLKNLVIDISHGRGESGMFGATISRSADILNGETICVDSITRLGLPSNRPNALTTLTLRARVSTFFVLCLLEESPLLQTCELDLYPNYSPRLDPDAWPVLLFQPQDAPLQWAKLRKNTEVVLHNLQDFKLFNVIQEQPIGSEELAGYLRIPKLRKLQLSNYDADLGPFFEKCLSGSRSTLKSLDLRHLSTADQPLLNILRGFPNIEGLTLYRLESFSGALFDDLQLDEHIPILPRLHHLDIAGNWKHFDDMALVRFVKSRGRSWKRDTWQNAALRKLEWALFQDWLYPELYVRYDAFDPSVKLLRTVKVDLGKG